MGVSPRFAPSVSSVGKAGQAQQQRHSSKEIGHKYKRRKMRCFQQVLLVSRVNYPLPTHLVNSMLQDTGATAAHACTTIFNQGTIGNTYTARSCTLTNL